MRFVRALSALPVLIFPAIASAQGGPTERFAVVDESLLNASARWHQHGVAPRCDNPSLEWSRTSRNAAVLALMTSYNIEKARWDIAIEDNEGSNVPMKRFMDNVQHIYMPHWVEEERGGFEDQPFVDQFRFRDSWHGDGFYWGLKWDYVDPDIHWLFEAAARVQSAGLKGFGTDDELKHKYGPTYCIDASGNFRATVARDSRVEKDDRSFRPDGPPKFHGAPTHTSLIPKDRSSPVFPVGRVETADPRRAVRNMEMLYQDGEGGFGMLDRIPAHMRPFVKSSLNKQLNERLPNLSRWDVVMAPYIKRVPVRVFKSPVDFLRYRDSGGKAGNFFDDVVFEIHAFGVMHKHQYPDDRMGSNIALALDPQTGQPLERCKREEAGLGPTDACEPGTATQASFQARRVARLRGWDPLTRSLVARATTPEFARGKDDATAWLGNPQGVGYGETRDQIDYNGPEYYQRQILSCGSRRDADCIDNNPLLADTVKTPQVTGICPAGYIRVAVDASSEHGWDRNSGTWTIENYESVACPDGDCGSRPPTPRSDTQALMYECRQMTEAERKATAGGNRGSITTQSREERLRCRREGNCQGNNAAQSTSAPPN